MNSQVLRNAPRVFGAAALFASLLTAPAMAATATLPDATITGAACEGDAGVTVVVDFTDTGGDIVIACAEGEQESGRAALEAAGFTPEDSMPGMICTINNSPDPCPEEFDGNFWSYWTTADGDWEMYMVGADDAEPALGAVEGWRYSDGEEGPRVHPEAVLAGDFAAGGTATAEDQAAADAEAQDEADTEDDSAETPTADAADSEATSSSSTGIWITVVAVLVGGLIALYAGLTARKRRTQQ